MLQVEVLSCTTAFVIVGIERKRQEMCISIVTSCCGIVLLQIGQTPLHMAACDDKGAAVATVLLDHHADVNATDMVS